ncbi:MAG TPA: ABC transporter permease [Chthoniobacterales bacterium]|nr:ABC transporter permease [Chthoniobacterales bacterium]
MKLIAYLRSFASRLFRRTRTQCETSDELSAHIELRADALERSGLTRAEAARRARLEFGNPERFKEECREAMAGNVIDNLWQDLRFSLRTLRKSPGFFAVAVITLALGIGATVAAFSVVNAVLLRPFGFNDPQRLLFIYSQRPDNARTNFSLPEYCDYRDQTTTFEALSGVASFNPSFADAGAPERVQGVKMSANSFALLGVRPQLGRALIADDDRNGAKGVVVISYGLWSRRYAKNPDILGRPVNLNGEIRDIVGVLPASFALPNLDSDVVVPLQPDADPRRNARNSVNFLRMIGRLKPGVSPQQAQAELNSIRQNLQRQFPDTDPGKVGITIVPLTGEIVANVKSLLLTIFGAAGAVLLVGCVNLAGISLSRAGARQRELAMRAALGASRSQLSRLLLAESFVLALIGGVLGLLIEFWGQSALLRLVPNDLPRIDTFSIDWTVLIFASSLVLLATILCGLAPAWLLSRSDLRSTLVSGGRGSAGGRGQSRLRSWLVAGQIALALVLLANAGLLFRSFLRLSGEQPGFDPTDVHTMRFSLPQTGYADRNSILRFYEKLQSRAGALPAIKHSALVSILPLAPKSISFIHFSRPDKPPPRPEDMPSTNYRVVTPDYFAAMGIPLREGRLFTDADDGDRVPVVIVSSVLAKNHFPDRSPIGQRLLIDDTDGPPRPVEIVGIVGPVRQTNLETEAKADVYLPLRQIPREGVAILRNSTYWVVRTHPGLSGIAAQLSDAMRNVDGNVAISAVRPMEKVVAGALAARRFSLFLIGGFAAAALFLAAAGLYAVISYAIQQRTREIGVRLALGARRANILAMLFKEGVLMLAGGLAAGFVIALLIAKAISNQMYGVSPRDPISFCAVSLILAIISLAACGIAARRAVRIDPVVALRWE